MRLFFLLLTVSSLALGLPARAEEHLSPPSLDELRNLTAIGIEAARDAGLTGAGVTVGILDDAVDADHPEFADRILDTYSYFTGAPVDFMPASSHGTHVLGTLAGQNVGVASGADILAAAIFDPRVDGLDPDRDTNVLIPNAIRWAVDGGARVINNSWGFDVDVTDVTAAQYFTGIPDLNGEGTGADIGFAGMVDAFRHAADAGVVMVWANGNTSFDNPTIDTAAPFHFPELKPTWITVAALAPGGVGIAPYSNRCGVAADFCITAPGGGVGADEGILSSVVGGGYESYDAMFEGPWSGTSMAAPHVSGAVAIGMEMFPDATSQDITQFVLRTAIDIGEEGVDDIYGWGFLSLGNMVAATSPATASVHANAAWSRFSALEFANSAMRQMSGGSGLAIPDAEDAPANPIWVVPLSGVSRIDGGPASAAATSRSFGFVAGADLMQDGAWTFGSGGGYTRTTLDESGRPDTADTDTLHGLVYARYDDGPWFAQLNGQLAAFWQDVERHSISGTVGTSAPPVATAQMDGMAVSGDLRFGRDIHTGAARQIGAYLAANAMTQRSNGFTERDAGVFGLTGDRSTLSQYAAGVGLRWTEDIAQGIDTRLQIVTDIAVMRRFGDLDHGSVLSLLGRPVTASTDLLSEDLVRISGRIVAPMKRGEAYIGYDATLPDDRVSLSLGLGLTF